MEKDTQPYLAINYWAEEDRPREKLLLKGKTVLTDAELVAILLGTGTTTLSAVDLAKQILASVNYDLHALGKLSVKDLTKFKGIGQAKAITIVSALELGRRRKEADTPKRLKIKSSTDAYELIRPDLTDLPHEEFWAILLRKNNEVISKERVSIGGVSATVADPKMIFKKAVDALAAGIIVAHNHPSNTNRPSHYDTQLTQKLKRAGEALDIPLLDHLIITDHEYYSFADESNL
ncbi:RadC family protein [Marinoscillum furvescens]|uniref:DNA replication and repair protein RadC n=1 Tax=Marinoscillum furvescens DSM 4134 TaxID=1122208 RepID=A0A3D9KYK4_MARFU|nr:DNA repair protein RadC [Marinoscillum furvescens]RED92816.1 DNA replication and repair protein RadC [Marinoscillum furvescens DSM 4134]